MNSGLDGLKVPQAIRGSQGPSANAPALLVTPLNQDWQRIDGLLNGADDYFYWQLHRRAGSRRLMPQR
jgi:DNA-binding response OmpR family regulator